MFDLFGSAMPLAAKFFIAFAVVLGLIGLTAWLVRRFGANRLGGGGARGRQPRLAVIDAAPVDGRRRLVLIRRDNIEHLLMIGGPTDLVVEPNIVRAVGAVAREPAPARIAPELPPRAPAAAPVENSWPLAPVNEPAPMPAQRAYRSVATEEPWLPPEPGARARPADSLTGLAAELSSRLNPPDMAAPPSRPEPRANHEPRVSAEPRAHVAPPPPSEPPASPQNDHNLAEMAQQLEAALRRAPEPRPPVTDPFAAPLAAPSKPAAPVRDFKRSEPKFEPPFEPKHEARPEPRHEPRPELKAEPRHEPAEPGKELYDNLEQEMASLLGRPSGKS